MSVASRPPQKVRDPAFHKPQERESLDVSAQDRASSMIVALLVMLGMVVLLMFLVWLSSRLKYNPPVVPITLEELGGGGSGDGSPAGEQQLEEVSPEEVQDLQETPVDQTIQAVTDAVSTQMVNLEALEGGASGFGSGQGTGTGDGRGPGPGGPGTATQLPDWEVRFNASTLDLYAQQLDHFGIELAAVGGGKKTVDYASKLATPKPTVRSAAGDKEKRRYLVWRKGPLAAADKSLLSKAGIDTSGRIVLQFLPPDVERRMALLEAQHAKGKKLNEIRRTVFGVRGGPGSYEFYVVEQDYRTL
jgi:hypothetical protein